MKKIIALALAAALVSPAFAQSAKTQAAPAKPAAGKKNCDDWHEGMGGYGMMGGYGGMMGEKGGMMMSPDMPYLRTLNLTPEQRSKITKLADDLKHNNWATQGMLNDETAKLRDLYEADKRDPAAIGQEYRKVFELKRQMIEAYLNTQNSIEDVLTPEQRAQLKEQRSRMRGMYGHGYMMH